MCKVVRYDFVGEGGRSTIKETYSYCDKSPGNDELCANVIRETKDILDAPRSFSDYESSSEASETRLNTSPGRVEQEQSSPSIYFHHWVPPLSQQEGPDIGAALQLHEEREDHLRPSYERHLEEYHRAISRIKKIGTVAGEPSRPPIPSFKNPQISSTLGQQTRYFEPETVIEFGKKEKEYAESDESVVVPSSNEEPQILDKRDDSTLEPIIPRVEHDPQSTNQGDHSDRPKSQARIRRKRIATEAKNILEEHFARNEYPWRAEIDVLAQRTNLTRKQIRTWFSNMRARGTVDSDPDALNLEPIGDSTSNFPYSDEELRTKTSTSPKLGTEPFSRTIESRNRRSAMSSHGEDPAPVDAASVPPPSPAIKRRPTIGDDRKDGRQNSPRKPLQRSGSVSSRNIRPPKERRSTATEKCTNPNCTKCGPNAVRGRTPQPSTIDSALDISYPPSDQRSQRSDPAPVSSYISQPSPTYARQPDTYTFSMPQPYPTQLVAQRDIVEPRRRGSAESHHYSFASTGIGYVFNDDEYSYTDAEGMYRDTEPAWTRVGRLEQGSRPSGMIVNNRAHRELLGPPPSIRGFDKINNGVRDRNARSSSIDELSDLTPAHRDKEDVQRTYLLKENPQSSPWMEPDDYLLIISRGKGLLWEHIAARYFPPRTPDACRERYEYLIKKQNALGSDGPPRSDDNNSSSMTPTSRRGRKQPLSEDLSRAFICNVCSRRFRRSEHLKRHYTSLHAQKSPHECTECGKKFSRPEHLSQHWRTHGAGGIVMRGAKPESSLRKSDTVSGQIHDSDKERKTMNPKNQETGAYKSTNDDNDATRGATKGGQQTRPLLASNPMVDQHSRPPHLFEGGDQSLSGDSDFSDIEPLSHDNSRQDILSSHNPAAQIRERTSRQQQQQQQGIQTLPGLGLNMSAQQFAIMNVKAHVQQHGIPNGQNAQQFQNQLFQNYYQQIIRDEQRDQQMNMSSYNPKSMSGLENQRINPQGNVSNHHVNESEELTPSSVVESTLSDENLPMDEKDEFGTERLPAVGDLMRQQQEGVTAIRESYPPKPVDSANEAFEGFLRPRPDHEEIRIPIEVANQLRNWGMGEASNKPVDSANEAFEGFLRPRPDHEEIRIPIEVANQLRNWGMGEASNIAYTVPSQPDTQTDTIDNAGETMMKYEAMRSARENAGIDIEQQDRHGQAQLASSSNQVDNAPEWLKVERPYQERVEAFQEQNPEIYGLQCSGVASPDRPTADDGPEYSILVGDLGPEVTEFVLVSLFQSKYPSCKSVKIMSDLISGVSRGYGFVHFSNKQDQQAALSEMQGVYCGNRPMRILIAVPKNKSGGPSDPSGNDGYDRPEHSFALSAQEEARNDDNESVISSSANSVFSIASLASSATDLSKRSGYSATQIATATRELILIFHGDEVLVPLYKSAINNQAIGPERLQRNLRRLFKSYAKQLEDEAKDGLEYLASRLVAIKSRYLAQSIIEKFQSSEPKENAKGKPLADTVEIVDESSEEEEAIPINEDAFDDLALFRDFILRSEAFEALRCRVRLFVSLQDTAIRESGEVEEVQKQEEVLGKEGPVKPCSKELHNKKVRQTGRLDRIKQYYEAFTVSTGYLEPPLPKGTQRLRWKCKCGKSFFDDVIELKSGGIVDLKARMERSSGVAFEPQLRMCNSSQQKYIYQRPFRWVQNGVEKFVESVRQSRASPLPSSNSSLSTTNQHTGPNGLRTQILHMMACMHKGRHGKNLYQDRVENLTTDRQLFKFLKDQYVYHKGKLRTVLTLYGIQGIFFVKFRLPMGGSVEVRHHDPCCRDFLCECLPPESKVEPAPQAEYRCRPIPPTTVPPVLPEYLMHLFTSPSCVNEHDTWILDQLPKRTCGELYGKVGQPTEGWGIYYKEGWDRDKITLIVFILFVSGSLLFGALWSKFKMDVQGAFGVSAYMVAACGILVSLIATRVDKP